MEFTNPLKAWLPHLITGKLIHPTNQRPYQHLLPLPNLSTRVAADMQPGQLRVSKDLSRQPVPSTQGSLPSRFPSGSPKLGDAENEVHGTPLD